MAQARVPGSASGGEAGAVVSEQYTTEEMIEKASHRLVYTSLCEKREDGYTWLGGRFDEYDRDGHLIERGEPHWTGRFTFLGAEQTDDCEPKPSLWRRILSWFDYD